MVSFASAATMTLDPLDTQGVSVGESATWTITVNINDAADLVEQTINYDTLSDDVVATLSDGTTTTAQARTGSITWTPPALGTYEFTYTATALSDANSQYTMHVFDEIIPGVQSPSLLLTVKVPEFPTVALPIAAVIGLAFIFQRRKEE